MKVELGLCTARVEAYLTTVGCRESESDNSWKWLQVRKRHRRPYFHIFQSEDARCEEDEALGDSHQILGTAGTGTANLQPDQRLRYSVRNSDSFLWRGSPPNLIHQHQGPRGRKTYEKSRSIAEARGPNTYQVSLHNLPSRWKTCSNSSPCRHRLKVARAGNRAPYTNISFCLTDYAIFVTHPKLAYSAGTKHPHIPMIVRSPTCLRYVLLPTHAGTRYRGDKFDHCLAIVTVLRKPRT